jgi:magnesium-transporting ATPase (P-type)
MEFKQFSLNGVIYCESEGEIHQFDKKENDGGGYEGEKVDILNNEEMMRFFEALTLCHTVQIDTNSYQGSPDEFSFIQFCIK